MNTSSPADPPGPTDDDNRRNLIRTAQPPPRPPPSRRPSPRRSRARPAYTPTFVPHGYPERTADLGEIAMNYVVAGSPGKPALLLIPGQTESWWGYEAAIKLLEADFQVYAVDLRGQGRSTWTPGRYTLDNMGNDLVRFIATVIKRPVVTSGCSSGARCPAGWRPTPCQASFVAQSWRTRRCSPPN